MIDKEKWIYGELVRNRWGVNERTLEVIVYNEKLPVYDENNERIDDPIGNYPDTYKFMLKDIEQFEIKNEHLLKSNANHGELKIDAKGNRELGRLRREKEKWNSSIDVAVKIGIFCHQQNRVFNRHEIEDEVFRIVKNLPGTTFEKIWKAIPEQYKSKGGRPKK
jgi:hypothetical protein